MMSEARRNIDLPALDVEAARLKRAANGDLLMESPGPEGHQVADRLAAAIQQVCQEKQLEGV